MPDHEERRVWRAFQAVYGIRLLRPCQPPHTNHPRGGAISRHVEFALLMKPVFASPAGLVPTVGDVDSGNRSILAMHYCLQVGCQRRQKFRFELNSHLPPRRSLSPSPSQYPSRKPCLISCDDVTTVGHCNDAVLLFDPFSHTPTHRHSFSPIRPAAAHPLTTTLPAPNPPAATRPPT